MHSDSLNALLVAIPLLLVLVAFMLRADEFFAASDKSRKPSDGRRKFAVAAKDGENVMTDPDGRPVEEERAGKQPTAGSSRR